MDQNVSTHDSDERWREPVELHDSDSSATVRPVNDPRDSEDTTLTLLERLDRRQNRILKELDQLNDVIERLVTEVQHDRQRAPAA